MRIAFGLVVFLAACGSDSDMLPVGGGSGNGLPDSGMTNNVDAHLIDARMIDGAPLTIDAALFSGRVCLLTDPRDFNSCSATGAANLTVHIGGSVAITAADGTFKIAAPQGGASTWSVTGSNIVSSYKVKNDYFIPALTRTMYDAMKTANGIFLAQGEGSIMVRVIHNGSGYAGSTASASTQPNPAKYLPFYDGSDPTTWNHAATSTTGAQGTIWLVGYDVGDAQFTIAPPAGGGTAVTESGQPVNDQAITWDDVIING
ncbi:MAG TPA: hypothetical protein VMZ53_13985 [Kofleriaceae bacterium]|nr:hypothetical protein [Kofleriaceae bacterium]